MTHLMAHLMNGLMKLRIHPTIASSALEAETMVGCFSFFWQAWTAFCTAPMGHRDLLLGSHI